MRRTPCPCGSGDSTLALAAPPALVAQECVAPPALVASGDGALARTVTPCPCGTALHQPRSHGHPLPLVASALHRARSHGHPLPLVASGLHQPRSRGHPCPCGIGVAPRSHGHLLPLVASALTAPARTVTPLPLVASVCTAPACAVTPCLGGIGVAPLSLAWWRHWRCTVLARAVAPAFAVSDRRCAVPAHAGSPCPRGISFARALRSRGDPCTLGIGFAPPPVPSWRHWCTLGLRHSLVTRAALVRALPCES